MTGNVDFETEKAPDNPSDLALKEHREFGLGANKGEDPPSPNTVLIKLWKGGHLSFHPENSAPIFSFLLLFVLIVLVLLIAIIGLCDDDPSWLTVILQALGQAIMTIVGAVITAASGSSRRRR